MEFYLKAWRSVKNNSNSASPLLFGSFTHNSTEESQDSKVKTVNFYSKIYNYNEILKNFDSVNYEIINIKDSSYPASLNPISNFLELQSPVNTTQFYDTHLNKLKSSINDNVGEIEKRQKELKDLKAQLKAEFAENKKLFEKLKTFET
jgi:hypothetical protein